MHQAARVLKNAANHPAEHVRRQLGGLIGSMQRHRRRAGELESAVDQFHKVARSYWAGLFHTYTVPGLPGTNNDLEHFFGATRFHDRRATDRKTASPSLVVRGPVRVIAAAATRVRTYDGAELALTDRGAWKALRRDLDSRRHVRRLGTRFRRDPEVYLNNLEVALLERTLPS